MKRAAIYARFSSELQNPRSIDDQVDLCRAHCAREGLLCSDVFSDRAQSGASTAGRRGLDSLLAAAAERRFDVVVVEALDRLSRDMADLATIYKLLRFAGIALVAVHDGIADEIAIGVRGLVGALYLTDLAHKTRRGLAGKISRGQRAGGIAYGYRAIPGKPGEHEIFEPEAQAVREIFRLYAAGDTPRRIAATLNAQGIRPARGRAWNASTINGSTKRASGMLSNEVYAGRIVWNRVGKVRNPTTGRKVPRINERAQWQRTEAPHLRIVDGPTWDAVQARLEERRCGPKSATTPNRTRLLSGLLKCSVCGSGIVSAGSKRGRPIAQCSRVAESGDCTNKRRLPLDTIEAAVVDGLSDRLRDPERISFIVRAYHEERRRLTADGARDKALNERRLADIRGQIRRLVDALAEGSMPPGAVGRRLGELEAEETRLVSELEAAVRDADVVAMHPKAIDSYLAELDRLATAVRDRELDEAYTVLRRLVDRVIVYPREAGDAVTFDIVGRLAALIDPGVGPLVPREGVKRTHRPEEPTFLLRCSA